MGQFGSGGGRFPEGIGYPSIKSDKDGKGKAK